jgi:flagellar hook protein FlgE
MTVYSAFTAATLGMKSQSYALNALGDNIANVNSGGYRRSDVNFAAFIHRDGNSQTMGGVRPVTTSQINQAGLVQATQRNLDVTISGEGFFILNTALDGTGQGYYSRDGSFQLTALNIHKHRNPDGTPLTIPGEYQVNADGDVVDTTTGDDGNPVEVPVAFLTDKNGYFVMGWAANDDGTFPTSGAMRALRLDTFAFNNVGLETSNASLNLNLDAVAPAGDVYEYDISLYDTDGTLKTLQLQFTKEAAVDTWQMNLIVPGAETFGLSGGSSSTVARATGAGLGSELVFDTASHTIRAQAAGGGAAIAGFFPTGDEYITITGSGDNDGKYLIKSVSLDGSTIEVDERTPLNGTSATDTADIDMTLETTTNTLTFSTHGALTSTSPLTMDITWADGDSNSVSFDISEMTQFAGLYNPVLYTKNGYAAGDLTSVSFDSQGYVIGAFEDMTHRSLYRVPIAVFTNPNMLESKNGMVFAETDESGAPVVRLPGSVGAAYLNGGARELSNVDLSDQFTKMIATQTAYNASSKVFRTADEFTVKAKELLG